MCGDDMARCDPKQKKRWKDELDNVNDRLNAYYQAETAIITGAQEYRIGSRSLRRGDLKNIQDEINRLNSRKDELENAIATCTSPNKRKAYRILYRDL